MNPKFKLKYLIGSLVMGAICLFSAIHPERYNVLVPIIFGALFVISLSLLIGDINDNHHDNNNGTHAVADSKTNKIIKAFDSEEDAIEFADNQPKDTKVILVNIK